MRLDNEIKQAMYECKIALGEDVRDDLIALHSEFSDNLETPYNSKSRQSTDIKSDLVITRCKELGYHVEKIEYRTNEYPVIYTPDWKTAILIYKRSTLDQACKRVDHYLWNLCSAINGVNNNKNYLGQQRLFDGVLNRNQDILDDKISNIFFGTHKDRLENLCVLSYHEEYGIVDASISEYDGKAGLMDSWIIEKPSQVINKSVTDENRIPLNNTDDSNDKSESLVSLRKDVEIK